MGRGPATDQPPDELAALLPRDRSEDDGERILAEHPRARARLLGDGGGLVVGGVHGSPPHFHCDYCKSWMVTRVEGPQAFVNVRATMLADHSWFVPFVETATAEALPWAKTGAKHSL